MRKIYTDKLYQIKDDIDIQLIDGKIFEWGIKSERIKIGQTVNDFFVEKFNYLKNRKVNVYGFVFYNVSSHELFGQDGFLTIVRYAPLIEDETHFYYDGYKIWREKYDKLYPTLSKKLQKDFPYLTLEQFIKGILTDTNFASKWGYNIRERDLTLEERSSIAKSNHNEVSQNIRFFTGVDGENILHKNLDEIKIPTKIKTIIYKDKILEVYE